jgi:hypothetical protein
VALAALVLALPGCTSSSDPSVEASAEPSVTASASVSESETVVDGTLVTERAAIAGSWRAVELYGDSVEDLGAGRKRLDLLFEQDDRGRWTWSSTDLCNFIGGRFTVEADGAFDAESDWSTAALCRPGSKPGELNIKAITSADQVWLGDDKDRLTLGVKGRPVAVYVRL